MAPPGPPSLRRALTSLSFLARRVAKRAGLGPAAAALTAAPLAGAILSALAALAALAVILTIDNIVVVLAREHAAPPPPPAGAARAPALQSAPARPGVSLVAACRGRRAALEAGLASWLAVHGVDEVVLVDWASDPPLADAAARAVANAPRGAPPVRVVRVEGERDWVLSRAFNLGVAVATREDILRTDCDYSLSPKFARRHGLHAPAAGAGAGADAHADAHAHVFYAGDYRAARDENEVHLNGAAVVRRSAFRDVAGYDERVQTYGWDDTDLYNRLVAAGGVRRNVSYDHVRHVRHSEAGRRQAGVRFAAVEIDLNELLLKRMQPWGRAVAKGEGPGGAREAATRWGVVESETEAGVVVDGVRGSASGGRGGARLTVMRVAALSKPASLREVAGEAAVRTDWNLALGRRLHDDHEVPWDFIESMDVRCREAVLQSLVAARADGTAKPRLLFAHVQHGLGNRLRALASALSFARATGRVPVLVWESDRHISAEFDDLFEARGLAIVRALRPRWPFTGNEKWDSAWKAVRALNYLETDGHGAVKDQWVVDTPGVHMYWKSSAIMAADSALTSWEADNARLRELVPVREVRDAVAAAAANGLSSRIGLHIRDRTLDRDIRGVNSTAEYGAEASSTLDQWRRASSRATFAAEVRRILAQDADATFYVASDTVAVVDELAREFRGRVAHTPRNCDGRDARCVRHALVDMLCLARTRALYGSNWSSFTEAAMRFGAPKALLAGQDFGVAPGAEGEQTGPGEAVAARKAAPPAAGRTGAPHAEPHAPKAGAHARS